MAVASNAVEGLNKRSLVENGIRLQWVGKGKGNGGDVLGCLCV